MGGKCEGYHNNFKDLREHSAFPHIYLDGALAWLKQIAEIRKNDTIDTRIDIMVCFFLLKILALLLCTKYNVSICLEIMILHFILDII